VFYVFSYKKLKRQGNIYWRYFSWPKLVLYMWASGKWYSLSQHFPPFTDRVSFLTVWPEDYRIWGCAPGHSVILCSVINQFAFKLDTSKITLGGVNSRHAVTTEHFMRTFHIYTHTHFHIVSVISGYQWQELTKKPRCTALKIKSAF